MLQKCGWFLLFFGLLLPRFVIIFAAIASCFLVQYIIVIRLTSAYRLLSRLFGCWLIPFVGRGSLFLSWWTRWVPDIWIFFLLRRRLLPWLIIGLLYKRILIFRRFIILLVTVLKLLEHIWVHFMMSKGWHSTKVIELIFRFLLIRLWLLNLILLILAGLSTLGRLHIAW